MPESKAKEVAKLCGLELEEEFAIKGSLHKQKFTEDGLMCFRNWGTEWIPDDLNELIAGKCTIIKHKSVLTDMEKEYLSNIIKPFRDRIVWIKKIDSPIQNYEYIKICYQDNNYTIVLNFPDFKAGTMYRGMKIGKSYTLKELGIQENIYGRK